MKKFLAIVILLTTLVSQGWGDTEPNDSCVQGETWTTLTARGQSSSTMSGDVSSSNQNDYYKIVLTTSGSLQISGSSNQNTNYYILNSACTQLTSQTNTKTPNLAYTAAAGTYYLRINRNATSTYSNMKATLGYIDGERAFSSIYSSNTRGGVKIIGNSNLCKTNSSGVCIEPDTGDNNDGTAERSANKISFTDLDGDGTTFNSTSADLNLPVGAKIVFAKLFWQGYQDKRSNPINQVKFKKSGNSYQTVTATQTDTLNSGDNYQSSIDITNLVDVNNPNGTYFVANIAADVYADNTTQDVDDYAAWTLFVVYENPSESLKNITLWDGYDSITSGSTTITASGFRTPSTGAINSSFLIFSTEGDVQSTGDYIQINGTNLTNGSNPSNNPFNSTISSGGANVTARNPNYANTLGIDVDDFNVSSLLSYNQTSATIRIGTSGDGFYVSAFAFSTDIYSPAIGNFDKNVSVTYASSQTCEGNQDLRGATLDYEISFENTGTEAASTVRVYDDFQSNGILNYFDMTQTSVPSAQLLSGTAASTITCDKNATAVYCDFNRINIGTKYKINFSTKIKSTLLITDDLSIANTANAHYYNASTGDEITQIASSNMKVAGGICAAFPVADYRLDECRWNGLTGEVKDSIGTNHGTSKSNVSGNPTVATTVATGQINQGGEFKGQGYLADPNSSYYTAEYFLEMPDSNTLSPLTTTGAMSLTGWFQLNNANDQTILHKGNGSVQEYRVFVESNQLKFSVWNQYGGESTITLSSATLSTVEKYFFTATAELNSTTNELTMKLYLKNASNSYSEVATISSFAFPATSPGSFYVGAVKWGILTGFFDGMIDEIKVFDSALSESSINKFFTNELAQKNYDGSTRSAVSCTLSIPNAEYRFDECAWAGVSGEVRDNSANGYHGTALSSLTTQENGKICRMSTFNGSQYVTIPQTAADILRTTASLSFWIRTNQVGNNTNWLAPGIIGVEQSGANDDIFWGWLDASGRIGLNAKGDNLQAKSTVAINDGSWKHIVLTRDTTSGSLNIYINGVLNASGTGGTGTIGTTFSRIGSIQDTGGTDTYFVGDLDEVKIYDTVLAPSDVNAVYTNELNSKNSDGSTRKCNICAPALSTCWSETFSSADLSTNWTIIKQDNYTPQVVNGKLMLTDTTIGAATGITLNGNMPANNNYIQIEFEHNAYGGTGGADGIALVLSDASVTAIAGANGGSLGYAQKTGVNGFAGGWLGVGIDEYGNFSNPTEGRSGGPGLVSDSVALRGTGSGTTGYTYIAGTATLTPAIDNTSSSSPSPTDKYKLSIDTRNNQTWVKVERDTTGTGSAYLTLIDWSDATQSAITPSNFQLSLTGSTGSYTNYHSADNFVLNAVSCGTIGESIPVTNFAFDAWDSFRSISDRNISTKIVNKPFTLTVAALNEANTAFQDFNGTVCAKIINNADQNISGWNKLLFNDQNSSTTTFTINRAIGGSDSARVKLYWKKNVDTTCPITAEDNSTTASDRFAVRPASFGLFTTNAVAGTDFYVDFIGYNYNGSASADYNETSGGTFDVSTAEHNAACPLGTFTIPLTPFSFQDGIKSIMTRYSDVGIIDINITDLTKPCTSRFAKIDCDDLNVSDGTNYTANLIPIGLEEGTITIIPHHFDVNATLSNFSGGTFTYLSNDLNMSAQLDLNITAKNGEGNTTTNYTSGCYSKDTTLTLPHSNVPSPLSKILYHDSITLADTNITKASSITSTYAASKFTQGVVTPRITFNFDRNSSTPLNPFDFNITSADVNNSDHVLGSKIPLGDTTFVYGRVHAYDITTNTSPVNAPIEFEVYSTLSSGFVSGMPQNVLKWYRNLDHDTAAHGNVILGGFNAGATDSAIVTSASPADGLQLIGVTSIIDQTVHLKISPWLWYSLNPLKTYNYGTDCTQHPCFNYDYTDASAGVQGVNSGTFQGSDFQMTPAKNITNKGVKLFR